MNRTCHFDYHIMIAYWLLQDLANLQAATDQKQQLPFHPLYRSQAQLTCSTYIHINIPPKFLLVDSLYESLAASATNKEFLISEP